MLQSGCLAGKEGLFASQNTQTSAARLSGYAQAPFTPTPLGIRPHDEGWLDLDRAASVEVTSEEKDYEIDSALVSGETQGWRAGSQGTQNDPAALRSAAKPQTHLTRLRRNRDSAYPRVRLPMVGGWRNSFLEIVRHQWNFSSPDTKREIEEYRVQISDVTVLELVVVPDISRGSAHASLKSLRVS